ncbi:MAG: hypothetical protein WBV94_31890 [Blastocatellia bacterium]
MKALDTHTSTGGQRLRLLPLDDKAMIEQARMRGYLSISIEQARAEFLHDAQRRRKGQPSIVLKRYGRWYSVGAHMFGNVLTDGARNRIYQVLIAASLPGGMVRVSNRNIFATRLPFLSGTQIAAWLAAVAFSNREQGAGREHCRWESRKRVDGSVLVVHRGQNRPARSRAA